MTLRCLHLADCHLDTAFGGRQEATRARLRRGTREAFRAAVDLAIAEDLDALLMAGDGFDEERLDFATELWLGREVERLARAGVHLVWIAGNHDPGAAGGRLAGLGLGSAETAERAQDEGWGARVHVLRQSRAQAVDIHGPGGELRGRILGAGHEHSQVTENLAARFPARGELGVPVIGLLHTQVHAARGSAEHAAYAPSTEADLAAPGYDYWALGHVHQRGQPFARVPAWYAGNLCGRNPRESGPKGGLLIELEPGGQAQPSFVPLAPVQWERVVVDGLNGCAHPGALLDFLLRRIRSACEAAPRVELLLRLIPTGPCPLAHLLMEETERHKLEAELRDASGLLEVQLRPKALHHPRDLGELRASPSALAMALELAEDLEADPAAHDGLLPEGLASLLRLDPSDAAARQILLGQLTEGLAEDLLSRVWDPSHGPSQR